MRIDHGSPVRCASRGARTPLDGTRRNAILRPSGGPFGLSIVIGAGVYVAQRVRSHIVNPMKPWSPRALVKAMRAPSGDHTGAGFRRVPSAVATRRTSHPAARSKLAFAACLQQLRRGGLPIQRRDPKLTPPHEHDSIAFW
jgi:hypothetical protein